METMDWNELTLFEQLSNIAGEVKRLVDCRTRFAEGKAKKDYYDFYFAKVKELVGRTIDDPKNIGRGQELLDEVNEIERYGRGEVEGEYILRYWDQYTKAIS